MKGSFARNRFHPLVIAISAVSANVTYAEEISEAQTLPTIVVNAVDQEQETYTVKKTKTSLPIASSIREIPQSVSVISQQQIEDQGINNLFEIAENVTGVSALRIETNRGNLSARGFGIDNYQIDGVPTTYSTQWSSGEIFANTALLEHVEVVRGATGLMTGPGNPSAAINMVRKRATSKEFTGNVGVSAGSWNNYRTTADLANRLNASGSLRGRAVVQYSQGDSYIDLYENQNLTLLFAGEADLTDNTTLSAGVSYQQDDPRSPMWGGLPVFYSDGTRAIYDWSKSKTSSPSWTRWKTEYTNYFADLTHSFNDNWSTKLSYSRGDRDGHSKLFYLSGSPNKETGLGLSASASSYLTNTTQDDLSLSINGDFNWFGREHNLAFGYIYSKQDWKSDAQDADYGCGQYCAPTPGSFYDWNGSYPAPNQWKEPTFYENSETKQQAFYGVTRLSLLEPLKLVLGGRVSDYRKSGVGVWTAAYDREFKNEFTPYAGLIYDINKNFSAYVSYTSIFQPQNAKDFNGNYLDPIEGNNTEVGLKSEWFDGRLNSTLSIYQIKQDNLAQVAGSHGADKNNEVYYRAADGTESKGFEVEVTGSITPNWKITTGYSQFKATDATNVDVNPEMPRKTANLFTTYQLPGQWNALTIGGGVNWQDSTYINASARSAPVGANLKVEQGDYALVNLMARYQINSDFSAQLNINNLFDQDYYGIFPAYAQTTWGAPRNATLTLRYKF
ncbi:MAG: TonB-dependent siderophore receptor [Acinetobacter populi]|jgi:outer membrane receptor for ferric coprogen and ferric-rhodotorulic acid|uniref:TonB-dependent siderophore receptor n=1 Tax=Acinetobacter populi TaxID=1582270 RepID=UPI002353691A|nr:TonB-dependent siderophore receptor [Acinetobacter populi]MCH4248943.1 TonB-dependent siderophore receptor [Acinetobacter populi]